MKLRAQEAFLPVVADNSSNGLGEALLDGEGETGAVVDKLIVDAGVVLGWRREAGSARARRLLRLARPPSGRVHDDGFVRDSVRVLKRDRDGARRWRKRL